MENIDDIQLGLVKFMANAEKYFSLFDKHIPRFENSGKDRKFLLLGICNESVMLKICALNPKAKYYIADQEILSETLPLLDKNLDFKFYDSNLDLYDIIKGIDMKFDCIIMNPPYGDRYNPYLHNAIYTETYSHLKETGKCVCLMPAGKLQTPRLLDKKDLNNTKKITVALDIISSDNANKIFNIALAEALGIYVAEKNIISNLNWKNISFKSNSFFEIIATKIYSNMIGLNKVANKKAKNFSYCLSLNHGHPGAKDEYDLATSDETYVFSTKGGSQCVFFNFDTEIERYNFKKYIELLPMKFLRYIERNSLHIYLQLYPWLGDSINPRTKLKGYKSEWTDEDFYKFFNITPEEQKIIEETMEKYK